MVACANEKAYQPEDSTHRSKEINNPDNVFIPLNESTNLKGEWELVWHDDFNDQASLANWNLQDWASDKNEEWQYYSPENITVENEHLIIESRQEQFKGRNYTSGAMTTEGKFEFTYGKIEIKAKLPKGQGVFPAFWLVNFNEDSWLPEIDMMEFLGQNPNELHYVLHWEDAKGRKMRDFLHYESEEIDFTIDFHIYGLEWEKDKIIWTLDGRPVFETTKFSPDTPLFLYVNTAIGGVWPGEPNPSEEYPKRMEIDYVKVFQKQTGR